MLAYIRRSAVLASIVVAAALLAWPAVAQQTFSFGVFGDLAYVPEREPQLANVLADLDRTPLAFVVHLGDLGSPRRGSCTDELWARRLAQFRASANPMIYTPGDNDWTDCHEQQGVKGGDPAERLGQLRSLFFAGEDSFGRRTIPLVRQDGTADPRFAAYRENKRWQAGSVTFVTLHVVGSNNNRGRTPEADAEFAERNAASIAWMRAGFAHAKTAGSSGIVLLQQANPFPHLPPYPGDPKQEPNGFAELRAELAKEALAFGKPVLLVHGDSHFFRVDMPYLIRREGQMPVVANLTRLESFGDPFHHWVEIRVDPADGNVFTIRPRMVAANIGGGR